MAKMMTIDMMFISTFTFRTQPMTNLWYRTLLYSFISLNGSSLLNYIVYK